MLGVSRKVEAEIEARNLESIPNLTDFNSFFYQIFFKKDDHARLTHRYTHL